MAVKILYGLSGTLATLASSLATIIKVDANLSGAIVASGFVNGTDEAYLAIYTNGAYEIVKVTAVNGQFLTVERGEEGTTPQAFAAGSGVRHELTMAAVLATIGPIESTVQIEGTGLAVVTNPSGNNWNIHVEPPNFTGIGGIDVLGTYPDLEFTYTKSDCCGDEGGDVGDAITEISGTGIASAFANLGVAEVTVAPPVFSGLGGITVAGSWPNYTFTYTGGLGGGGSVTSVGAGTGITILGNPAVNPVVHITNTGVVAGTYGGVDILATGQIAAVPVTFNPISIAVETDPIEIVRAGDQITISVKDAAIGQKGVVELTDETDPFDPLDTATVMTPAAVAAAMATLNDPVLAGVNTYAGEADGDYTNTIGATATAIELAVDEKAIVYAEVTMINGATPLTPVDFGIAVFNATPTKIKSNRKMNQSQQSMSFMVEGPVTSTTWAIVTTAIPGGSTVVSYSFYILKLP